MSANIRGRLGRRSLRMGGVLAATIAAIGCGSGRPPPKGPSTTQTTAAPAGPASQRSLGDETEIVVDEAVRERCDLPDDRQSAPRFDFDSASLRQRGTEILDGIAQCARSGRFGAKRLILVGHADPRGSSEYNEALGRYRAEAARTHLLDAGVPDGRLVVESRGERSAKGTGPESWALDRRVEVHLSGADEMTPGAGNSEEPKPAPPVLRPVPPDRP